MDGSFLSPSAKRSIYTVNEEDEPPYSGANGSYKRYKPPPPLTIPDGHVAFRLLCQASLVGGLIGKSGNVIKQLQQKHSAKIRVEDSDPGIDEHIVVVIASSVVRNKVQIEEGSDAVEVSSAQEALLRVFEKILDVTAEEVGVTPVVSCRLLVDGSQVGGVIGKGGKMVESIRNEARCKVRVLNGNKLPACAGLHDELVEIGGDAVAVKKGIIAVSRILQDCPPFERPNMMRSKLRDEIQPEFRRKSFRPQGEMVSDSTQEMTYRILCLNERVGGVIGRGGTIVRSIQDDTGASISVGPTIEDCDERMITITAAADSPDLQTSPAQDAVMLVFSRSVEVGVEKGLDPSLNSGVTVYARLVIHKSQVGCVMGKGGMVISEMRRATGTNIRLLGDQVPRCAWEGDEAASVEVVQITGEFVNVQDALYQVTGRLRENFLFGLSRGRAFVDSRSNSLPLTDTGHYRKPWGRSALGEDSSPGLTYGINHRKPVDPVGLSHNLDNASPPRFWPSQSISGYSSRIPTDNGRSYGSLRSDAELGSGGTGAIVTNTTVEIVIPEHVLGNVYGENGSNLIRLRQISGAKVTVHDPKPGTRESIVIISGTPDETQAAQSLLHAFILTGGSS